ncbi:MAG: hypothetical protein WC997_00630 [Porticoccaceae bacterium]
MKTLVFFIALAMGSAALAHAPVGRCSLDGQTVNCEGRYDDGTRADGVTVSVITYDGETLHTQVLDRASRFQFALPTRPFYVLMDAGPGEMFEMDWRDIRGMSETRFETEKAAEAPAYR